MRVASATETKKKKSRQYLVHARFMRSLECLDLGSKQRKDLLKEVYISFV